MEQKYSFKSPPKSEMCIRDSFTVELELPEGATIERTREVTDRAMAFLMQDPDVEYVLNVTGSSPRVGSNQARSQLTVILKSWKERESEEISDCLLYTSAVESVTMSSTSRLMPP